MEEKRTQGRPKKNEELKSVVVSPRFTKAEYIELQKKADKSKVKVTTLVREFALKGYIKSTFTEEEQQIKIGLIGLANNLNQIAKKANVQGYKAVGSRIGQYLDDIDEILKKYKK